MRLLSFKASNLFSIGEVSLNLDKQGLLLVSGNNGAGKSSITNKGLMFTLYGQTAGGLKADAVINLYGGKTAVGTVEFIGNDNVHYQVKRERSPNRLTFTDLSQGLDLTQRHEKDTQQLIERALGRSFEVFLETDFFGQGKNRSFHELTTSQQIEVLETILPIDQLNDYADNAKCEITDIKAKVSILNTDISKLEGRIEEITKQKERSRTDSTIWDLDKSKKINNLQSKLSTLDCEKIQEDIDYIKETCKDIVLLHSPKDVISNLNEAKLLESDWKKVLNDRKRSTGKCDSCSQSIPSVEPHLVEEAEQGLEITQQAVAYWSREKFNQDFLASSDYKILGKLDLIKSINHLKEELEEAINSINPFEQKRIEGEEDLVIFDLQIAGSKERIEELNNQKNLLEFWVSAFTKDLRNYMIQKACPYLTDRANYYLNKLNNSKLSVEFSTNKTLASGDNRHKFTVVAKNSQGGQSYGALSGGEQKIVNFATGLALSDLASSQAEGQTNLMVLDEPFTELDDTNANNLVSFIETELLQKKETILLVSNEDLLKEKITNRINVQKINGCSVIT